MKKLALITAALMALSCERHHEPTTAPASISQNPRPSTPTFVLFGTVRDETGAPVENAFAMLAPDSAAGRNALSNRAGYFGFAGVAGAVTITVWKDYYEIVRHRFDVSGDTAVNAVLKKIDVDVSDTLILGRTMRSYVSTFSAPCDPVHWDSRAPCRSFGFVPSRSGTLVIDVTWDGMPPVDIALLSGSTVVGYSVDGGPRRVVMTAAVDAGLGYDVWFHAYYGMQFFTIRADLLP